MMPVEYLMLLQVQLKSLENLLLDSEWQQEYLESQSLTLKRLSFTHV